MRFVLLEKSLADIAYTHHVRGSRLLTQGRIFELSHAEGRSGHGGAQVAG